jgi:hypothetical protein
MPMRILPAVLAFVLVVLGFSIWPTRNSRASPDKSGLEYRDSILSSSDYLVTTLVTEKRIVGCGAVSRISSPPIVLMVLTEGSGTLSLVGAHYKIQTTKIVGKASISIGTYKAEKIFVVDGNIITLNLSKEEIVKGDRAAVVVNGVQIDDTTYKHLHVLVTKCIAAGL